MIKLKDIKIATTMPTNLKHWIVPRPRLTIPLND